MIGPDLSNVGRDRTPAQIEQSLRDPGNATPTPSRGGRGGRGGAYRAVTVRMRDGQTIRGVAKNESAFDLQLISADGKLHLLLKDQVAEVVREKSLMPKLDATPAEMRDLVAYLSRLTIDPNATATLAGAAGNGSGRSLRRRRESQARRLADLPREVSGNRFSPLRPDRHEQCHATRAKWMFAIPGAPRALEMTPS